jgi:AcrR family transcriptional regulator
LIVEAARAEFQANGYAGASMNAVAQGAGVSTKTLYRLVPTKADLFRSVVSQRCSRFLLEIDQKVVGGLDLQTALERILTAYGRLTLEKETTGILRLVLGECERFPELGEAFYETAIKRSGEAMADWLKEQCRKGLLDLDDPKLAAGALRGMMIMEPQRCVMLGRREAPDVEEIERRAKFCAGLFLSGCRRQPS